ncbi:MAG: hypothetical protein AAF202_12340, partial [Pseudomonadota bacterium]
MSSSSYALTFNSTMLCQGESFSVEFPLRPHSSSSAAGLVEYAFEAQEVVGFDNEEPVYGDTELFVNLAYLMNRENDT